MQNRGMAKTWRDIAREAGCSLATVSRVANGTGPVAAGTAARVRALLESAGGTETSSAAGVRGGRPRGSLSPSSDVEAVLFRNEGVEFLREDLGGMRLEDEADAFPHSDEFSLPRFRFVTDFYSGLLAGASDTLAAARCRLHVRVCRGAIGEGVAARIDAARRRGVLLLGNADPALVAFARRCRHPVVAVDVTGIPGAPLVAIDNLGGIEQMMDLLLGLGHRAIGFAGGREEAPGRPDRRRIAYYGSLAGSGLSIHPAWSPLAPPSLRTLSEQWAEVLSRRPRPTAVVCFNDYVAVAVYRAAAMAGLSVPADLSVVGFDDLPLARRMSPSLTSVRVDTRALGASAVEVLLRATSGGEAQGRWSGMETRLRTTLSVRDSAAPPASARR